MTLNITPEIRHAIDEQNGRPVFLVDTLRHETFVLLTADDFERVQAFLDQSAVGEWTPELENRRRALIDKDIAGSLAPDERVELAILDSQGNAHYDRIAPRPISGVRKLHRELVQKRDNQ